MQTRTKKKTSRTLDYRGQPLEHNDLVVFASEWQRFAEGTVAENLEGHCRSLITLVLDNGSRSIIVPPEACVTIRRPEENPLLNERPLDGTE